MTANPVDLESPPRRPAGKPGAPTNKPATHVPRTYYWMVFPAFVLFTAFFTIPVIQGVFYSFTDYAGYGEWQFVGFSNYINLFYDERILDSYWFTLKFSVLSTVLVNIIALAIAIGLNSKIKARNTFRGIFFIPNILAVLIIGYVFNFFFSNSLPAIAENLGITSLATNILADENFAWLGIVFVSVWQSCAFSVIIYLAGLQTISPDLYEASSLDGASGWRQFRSITFPLISAFFTINMVLSLKGFLNVFDQIVALTNGGPGTSTESISMVIYRGGFQGGDYAYQTANAVIYLIVIVTVSIFQLRVLQRREVSY